MTASPAPSPAEGRTTLLTVGHGTLPAAGLAELLEGAGVAHLVDVRAFPGSRRNPQFGQDEMRRWLPEAGIGYHWAEALGGRRRPVPDSRHVALRNESFRAYADHMETPLFTDALDHLLAGAAGAPTAVMCSESVWWRCHRRLLADHAVLVRGVDVRHLMHDGRLTPHPPTDGVRRDGDNVAYDLLAQPPLPL
ncbi:DUF488 domain-containing protein [Iamia sp. SCSIO 61187]|uniref:DUF488 domain-containing protein n=1 Tax=Iamia sp. SCSIO 61187 TaxID=2722752 RepID=UPI001C63A3E4|nr:DUF488 domain-containing protein [Iamia sp. SCSIO 61187]QYG93116.1 DUF488 domain-containing protein [Iamia sp. SCSIO 61187]